MIKPLFAVPRSNVKLNKKSDSLGRHNQQHDNVGSSELDSEDRCANELLFVGQLGHKSRGWWRFPGWYVKNRSDSEVEWTTQVVGLGKTPTSGVYLTRLTDKYPIVLPPEATYSFDKHNQDEHTDNTECKCRYGEHRSIMSIIMRTEGQHLWSGCAIGY